MRLKGSFASESRWDLMVDRSMTVLEEGRITGSRMRVYMSGSTILVSELIVNPHLASIPLTEELIRHLTQIIFRLQRRLCLLNLNNEQP